MRREWARAASRESDLPATVRAHLALELQDDGCALRAQRSLALACGNHAQSRKARELGLSRLFNVLFRLEREMVAACRDEGAGEAERRAGARAL